METPTIKPRPRGNRRESPWKTTGQVVRDLARVLVGQTTETVIDVTEESKPVLEAFLSDVHRKYKKVT